MPSTGTIARTVASIGFVTKPNTEVGVPSFADLPALISHALVGGREPPLAELSAKYDKVVLVVLDGFGRRFLERHARHSLVQRFQDEGVIVPLRSQFPSTTTAHMTTLHTGLPTREHGLYEWNIYEPSLDRIMCPLPFCYAGDQERESLAQAGIDPAELFPFETFYERLMVEGVPTTVLADTEFVPSSYTDAMFRGAELVVPIHALAPAIVELGRQLARPGPRYVFLYDGWIDYIGHVHGPDSEEFDAQCDATLTLIERHLLPRLKPGTLLLVTADHGQITTDPAATVFLDEIWPPIRDHLRTGRDGRPLQAAGSPRDVFLHVREDDVSVVESALAEALAGHAEVCRTQTLIDAGVFGGPVSQRLADRIGNVAVLPAPGEAVWLRDGDDSRILRYCGLHGGLTDDEMLTYVAALA